ncbi:MAG: (deoxy)nucleoside triphosphate pyrophosphohydrolase [Bacteroidetes bacterium]|nr:(deoxy)nucleoside triphosphate pyrophosphohydrolase [Bacteroidota bacterium]
MNMAFKWEFPGGKIEPDESPVECIHREIYEELDIKIEIMEELTTVNFDYPNFSIELIPFKAIFLSGDIVLKDHINYLWLLPKDLRNLDWAEADISIVEEVIATSSQI